jgi:prephenate dehydratase
MNIITQQEINNWIATDINELTVTYPGWWVWSRKAIEKLLKQLNNIWSDEVTQILQEDPNIQQAWNPTELAEALSEHIPSWIVLLPIYNKYGWNVTWTLMAIMDYYEKNWVMPRILGNVEVEIEHCLCWKSWQSEEEIKNWIIYSHWQAIKQCGKKINKYWIKTESVGWTSVKLEEAKENNWIFLLLDKDTAIKNWLAIYENEMWPKNNHTSFAVITSDPKIELPKIKWNKDINVWIIKADNHHWWLLLSLLPLILTDKKIDMKAITSSLNWNIPMIWIVWDWNTFDQTKGLYEHLSKKNPDALVILMRKLNCILRKNYCIKVEHNKWKSYTISSKNKPWALIKMLILLEYNKINLNSINSVIKWEEVNIIVETDDEITWISEVNMHDGIEKYLCEFINNNTNRIHEIITVWK